MFKQFFKPKWQHKDPAQRLSALQELSPDTARSQKIIAELCHDTDPQIQKTAISLCTDTQLLDRLAQAEAPTNQWAKERHIALLSEQGEEALSQFIRTSSDTTMLVQLSITHEDVTLRTLAVRRLTILNSTDSLLKVASESRHANTRLQAAQLLENAQDWRELQKSSRDKAVQQWVREQLRQHHAQLHQLEQQATERNAILQELEQHQRRPIDNLYQARLTQWQQQWQNNLEGLSEEEGARFITYVNACEERIRQLAAEHAAEQARQTAKIQQASALEDYQSTLKRFSQPYWEQEYGQIAAALTLLKRHWQQLSTHYSDAAKQEHFAKLQAQWQKLQSSVTAYFEFKQQVEDSSTPLQEAAANLLATWPEELYKPAELLSNSTPDNAQHNIVDEPKAPTASAEVAPYDYQQDKLFFQLRNALRQRNLRQANRLWQRLENELDKEANAQREQRFHGLKEQLDELQDWHNFAAEPKKEALCQRMEALANIELEPQDKANAIQALHQEWRELMSSDQEADQALWERFKEASDQAYLPCKEHFAELDLLRAEKLKERQELCEKLSALLEKSKQDSNTDWQALFAIRRQAPGSYFAIEPVRYTDARPVDQHFSALLRSFDDTLTQVSQAQLPKHQALVDASAALAKQAEVSADAIKALQEQWQDLAWLHPKHYRKLNKSFRQNLNKAFANLNQQRSQARQQHEANKILLQQALREFKDTLNNLSPNQMNERIQYLLTLTCPPRERALAKQREELIKEAQNLIKQWPLKEEWTTLKDQVQATPTLAKVAETPELIIAAEVICQVESSESDKQKRFQWQLEQLPKMMTQGQAEPLSQIKNLLEQHQHQLAKGLTAEHQARLLGALEAIKP